MTPLGTSPGNARRTFAAEASDEEGKEGGRKSPPPRPAPSPEVAASETVFIAPDKDESLLTREAWAEEEEEEEVVVVEEEAKASGKAKETEE